MSEIKIVCLPKEQLMEVEDGYRCTEGKCSSVFKNISNFRMHLSKRHKIGDLGSGNNDKNAQYACPVLDCNYNINSKKGKFFRNLGALKQHYRKVHAEKRYICVKCNAGFSMSAVFQRHVKICGALFICGICQGEYNRNESLMVHLMRKHPEDHKTYIQNKKYNKVEEYIINAEASNNNYIGIPMDNTFKIHNLERINQVNSKDDNDKSKCSSSTNVNRDCFTQTIVKTVNKSSRSKTKQINAQTQTLKTQQDLLKDAKTNYNLHSKKMYKTTGTQTASENNTKQQVNDQATTSKILEENDLSQCDLIQIMADKSDNVNSGCHVNNIETQTALDELLYSKLGKDNDFEEESTLFSELISISDIQTQTAWPFYETTDNNTCDSSLMNNDSSLMFPDLFDFPDDKIDFTSTETQTCQLINDFNEDSSSFNISTPYFGHDCEYYNNLNIEDDLLDRTT